MAIGESDNFSGHRWEAQHVGHNVNVGHNLVVGSYNLGEIEYGERVDEFGANPDPLVWGEGGDLDLGDVIDLRDQAGTGSVFAGGGGVGGRIAVGRGAVGRGVVGRIVARDPILAQAHGHEAVNQSLGNIGPGRSHHCQVVGTLQDLLNGHLERIGDGAIGGKRLHHGSSDKLLDAGHFDRGEWCFGSEKLRLYYVAVCSMLKKGAVMETR